MASIQIWNRCNNKCIMCANPLWFSKEPESLYSYQEIVSRVRKLNNAGPVGDLQISGGEPTIHPDFLQIMRFIRTELSSAKLYLLSNGRMFTYEDFTGQVMALSDLVVEIPVLGHTARLHDSVTGISGSFEQTVSGIRNILRIKGEGRELELRVILVKQNYKYLGKIVEFIHAEFKTIDTLVIIFPEPEGRCWVNFKGTGITYSQVRKDVLSVMRKWKSAYRDLRLYHFPLCTIDHRFWPFCWVTQDPGETAYIRGCKKCRFRKYCPGIHKNYLEVAGSREFKACEDDITIKLNEGPGMKYHPITGVA